MTKLSRAEWQDILDRAINDACTSENNQTIGQVADQVANLVTNIVAAEVYAQAYAQVSYRVRRARLGITAQGSA